MVLLYSVYPSIAKAIDCWVMLKSIQTKHMVLNSTLPPFASLVTACLEIADMPIRIASARCLVFVKELMNEVCGLMDSLVYRIVDYSMIVNNAERSVFPCNNQADLLF